jgi:hypothetical protein
MFRPRWTKPQPGLRGASVALREAHSAGRAGYAELDPGQLVLIPVRQAAAVID